MPILTLIFAASYLQAREYARDQKLSISEWAYISDPNQIRGLHKNSVKGVFLPGWAKHPQSEEMQRNYELLHG